MDEKAATGVFHRYCKYSLWVVAALALLTLGAVRVLEITGLITPLVICVAYTLSMNLLYGLAWKKTATTAPATLTKFYLAASLLRMVVAVLVIVCYFLLIREREAVIRFTLCFLLYYVSMLVLDSLYFARVEQKSKHKEQ